MKITGGDVTSMGHAARPFRTVYSPTAPNPDKPEPKFYHFAQDFVVKCLTTKILLYIDNLIIFQSQPVTQN